MTNDLTPAQDRAVRLALLAARYKAERDQARDALAHGGALSPANAEGVQMYARDLQDAPGPGSVAASGTPGQADDAEGAK